jgi:hypothetical protein
VVTGDRGYEDEHFADHHVHNGQEQKAARKAMSDKPIGFGKSGARTAKHGRHKAPTGGQKTGLVASYPSCPRWLTAN